jgi:hypothetical protein
MRLLLNSLGSGIITAAADDDLSGIATYSVAGAQLGSKLLRTALLRFKSCVPESTRRRANAQAQISSSEFRKREPSQPS